MAAGVPDGAKAVVCGGNMTTPLMLSEKVAEGIGVFVAIVAVED